MCRFGAIGKSSAVKIGFLFLLFTAAVVLVRHLPGFDEHALAMHIRDKGAWGVVLFVGATAVLSAVGVPRQALSFAGGYAFGALYGVLFATLGTTLGCAGSFFLTRYVAKPFLSERFSRRMKALDAFVAKGPFTMTLTVRLMPFGNNALVNVLAGISSIPSLGFIAGSCIGYVPQNFIFALLGSGMRVDPFWRIFVSAVLFVLALLLGGILYLKHRTALPVAEKNIEL